MCSLCVQSSDLSNHRRSAPNASQVRTNSTILWVFFAAMRTVGWLSFAALLTTTGCVVRPLEQVPPGVASFSVASYNVFFERTSSRTIDAIADLDADIVCMQETTPEWNARFAERLSAQYPYVQAAPGQYADGLTVLSKFPVRDAIRLTPDGTDGWLQARSFVADTPIGPVQILVVHLRPLINYGSKIIGYFTVQRVHEREVMKYLKSLRPDLPTLIVGDFNEGNGGRAISALEGHCYRDALPEFDHDSPTWHGRVFKLPMTARLDHVLYTPATLHCYRASVEKVGESDHWPVVATFGSVGTTDEHR